MKIEGLYFLQDVKGKVTALEKGRTRWGRGGGGGRLMRMAKV